MKRIALTLVIGSVLVMPACASIRTGQKAPEFSLPSLSGDSTIALHRFAGKVVVLGFWASWCEPCHRELPELEQLAKEYAPKGVVVISIDVDQDRASAERAVSSLGITLPVAYDPDGKVAERYNLPRMPTLYVIDRSGTVRFVISTFTGRGDIANLRSELDRLSGQ